MIHRFLSQLLVLPLFLGISVSMQANIFLDAAQVHVNKIADKKPIHKSPVEFKQAVARYIQHTDRHYFCDNQRNSDENVSYKKELRYLFKNYEKLSVNVLLSRLRSAHQAMVKHDTDSNGEGYKKYEQICSALLLACAHVFVNDVRNQILQALDEIDNLIVYWRYQQHHQISYFFGKSPLKWIIGKNQEKEIIHNIIKLEYVQSKLYTLLGTLTGHIHTFTEIDTTYDDCYAWIEKLVSCVGNEIKYKSDGTRFDAIAAQLELKMKQVSKLKHNCMASLKMAKKPGHFVRHWIAYTTAVATVGYAMYFYTHNMSLVNKLIHEKLFSLHDSWTNFVVKPTEEVWNTIFGEVEKAPVQDFTSGLMKDINDLEVTHGVNKKTSDEFKRVLKVDHKNTQTAMSKLLNKWVADGRLTQDKCDAIIEAEKIGNITLFQEFVFNMDKYLIYDFIRNDDVIDAIVVWAELNIYHYASSLIQIVFELIVDFGIPVVKEVLIVLAKGNKEWASACKKVNLILNVAVLTPTIIVGWAGCNGLYKTYRWLNARDYSPIRIALADVNSLLIESSGHLDDHDYGKLVYLICKLRHKSTYLKDPLSNEFLADVAKLESKQYAAQTKRGIVENMFNKYAFLGRVAV